MNSHMHKIIIDYLNSPSRKLVIRQQDIEELPDIMNTFTELKELTIKGCNLKSLKNLPPNLEILKVINAVLTRIVNSEIPKTVIVALFPTNCIESFDLSETSIETIVLSNNVLSKQLIFPKNIKKIVAK